MRATIMSVLRLSCRSPAPSESTLILISLSPRFMTFTSSIQPMRYLTRCFARLMLATACACSSVVNFWMVNCAPMQSSKAYKSFPTTCLNILWSSGSRFSSLTSRCNAGVVGVFGTFDRSLIPRSAALSFARTNHVCPSRALSRGR